MLGKTINKKPRLMVATARFENWEAKTAEEVAKFTRDTIDQVKKDCPSYRYSKSTFDYTHDGHIDFQFHFVLKQFRGALSISRKKR